MTGGASIGRRRTRHGTASRAPPPSPTREDAIKKGLVIAGRVLGWLLLVGAITLSLCDRVDPGSALTAGLALLGGVFVLTTSSEKFRSAWQMAYPKRRLERLFCLFCAGSESRVLVLSIGLVVGDLTGDGSFLLWVLWALAGAAYVNFLVRIGLVCRHFRAGDHTES